MTRFSSIGVALIAAIAQVVDAAESESIDVKAPGTVPKDAWGPVKKDFISYSMEDKTSLMSHGAPKGTKPNTFTQNLLDSVANRTGEKPVVRVGGTIMDHAEYDPNQIKPVQIPLYHEQDRLPRNVSYGPVYFDYYTHFDRVKYIVEIPGFAFLNLTQAMAWTNKAIERIGIDNIYAFELGNEPNFYPGVDAPKDFDPEDYTKKWLEWIGELNKNVTGLPKEKFFSALGLGSPAALNPDSPWAIEKMFDLGINKEDYVKEVCVHYYQAKKESYVPKSQAFMNHTHTLDLMKNFASAADFLKEKHPDIPLVIGEIGSATANESPITEQQAFESTLGNALWTIDFMLYSASIGVTRVNMDQDVGKVHSAFQPVPFTLYLPDPNGNPPGVYASFYGFPFAADMIGPEDKVQITNIDLHDDHLAAYAAYQDNDLARVAVINFDEWNSTSKDTRPSKQVNIDVPEGTDSVKIDFLTGPGAEALTGVTYAGNQWTYESDGLPVKVTDDSQTVMASNNVVSFKLESSTAAIVYIKQQQKAT